jgi:hypothetical protein
MVIMLSGVFHPGFEMWQANEEIQVKGMNDTQFRKDLTGFLDTFPGARLCPRTGYEGLASWQNLSGLPFASQVRVFHTGFGMCERV